MAGEGRGGWVRMCLVGYVKKFGLHCSYNEEPLEAVGRSVALS